MQTLSFGQYPVMSVSRTVQCTVHYSNSTALKQSLNYWIVQLNSFMNFLMSLALLNFFFDQDLNLNFEKIQTVSFNKTSDLSIF